MLSARTVLDLDLLAEPPGMPALTVANGRSLAEAAAVCLEAHRHEQNVGLSVEGMTDREFSLRWPVCTEQMRLANADFQDATESGACGIALRLVRELTGFTAVQRSFKTTGFDYWIGPESSPPFQEKSRLEVSGIFSGSADDVAKRVRAKMIQTTRSDDTETVAYICIVEFSRPLAHLVKR